MTGKEKQIDTNLVADVTATAIRTPPYQRTAIVLVTGDANVIPALEKVLEEDYWQIEVYMWDHAISKKLKRFAEEHRKKVEVIPLDKYLDKLAFTNMKVDISNRRLLQYVKAYGIVLTMKPKMFKNRIPSKKWINQVESIAQWPVQYYWFESRKRGSTNDLVIVFKRDPRAGEFDVTNCLLNILLSDDSSDQEYRLRFVLKVQTFQQYIANKFKEMPDPFWNKLDFSVQMMLMLAMRMKPSMLVKKILKIASGVQLLKGYVPRGKSILKYAHMDCAVVKEHNATINTVKQTKLISFKGRVDVGIHSGKLSSARNMGMERTIYAASPRKTAKMLMEKMMLSV